MGRPIDLNNMNNPDWQELMHAKKAPVTPSEKLAALDNLLALFSLQRKCFAFGNGILIFHPDAPSKTRWVSLGDSEESWLEDAKLLAR